MTSRLCVVPMVVRCRGVELWVSVSVDGWVGGLGSWGSERAIPFCGVCVEGGGEEGGAVGKSRHTGGVRIPHQKCRPVRPLSSCKTA